MKRFAFFRLLQSWMPERKTASIAAMRIRTVLACDRTQQNSTARLDAELSSVLARYFTVKHYSCHMESDAHTKRLLYTLQAELIK